MSMGALSYLYLIGLLIIRLIFPNCYNFIGYSSILVDWDHITTIYKSCGQIC